MKIVHLCLACFYIDKYSYQENMLPKYHMKMGHNVEIIASLSTFDSDGKPAYLPKPCEYLNEYGISVKRLGYRQPIIVSRTLKRYSGTLEAIRIAAPDILFIHGCQFMDMSIVVKYVKKNPTIRVFVDNHADFSNSGLNWLSRNVLHRLIWKYYAQKLNPFVSKFFGVLPARVDWLIDMYGLPRDKCELLVMGADDELVEAAAKPEVIAEIRQKHGITLDDFLIVSGGKIDEKKRLHFLMEAVNKVLNPKVKLIIFGSVIDEMKSIIYNNESKRVKYIGWIEAVETYEYFASSDLVVFPGSHSVFWEQAAGQGIPLLCRQLEGTSHLDIGGNIKFLVRSDVDEMKEVIQSIVGDNDLYASMKNAAKDRAMKVFSYSSIAVESLRFLE